MAHTRKHRREQRLKGETKKTQLKVTPKKGTKVYGVDVTKGGVAGKINRGLKKLKTASKEDLTLNKPKKTINKVNPKQFDSRRIKKVDAKQFDSRKSKSKSTMTSAERAKAMAKKRIAAGKTIAQVKADNTAKMKARAKKRQADFKAKRKKK